MAEMGKIGPLQALVTSLSLRDEIDPEEAALLDGLSFRRRQLRKGEEPIRLTEREREILTALAERAGEVVPREELAAQGTAANDRTVDVQMNRLRRKIERDPADPLYLQTVRGVGYRLVTDRT